MKDLGFNEKNWEEVLESLGFTEMNNANFGGKVMYDDKGNPFTTYNSDDNEYKKNLYMFLSGAAYWKLHKMFN